MSDPIKPRVRYQAEFFQPEWEEWCDAGFPEKTIAEAKTCLANPARTKTRIVKQTTTFEVVEEMEPKS